MSLRALSRADFIIKICGITRLEDALAAVESGANAIGFNSYPGSPRYIEPQKAFEIISGFPSNVLKVAVLVSRGDPAGHEEVRSTKCEVRNFDANSHFALRSSHFAEAHRVAPTLVDFDVLQLHGIQNPRDIPQTDKRLFIATSASDAHRFPHHEVIIDTSWGQGKLEDWDELERLDRPFILSGGLTPENVGEAIRRLKPAGVDVCTGVESRPGIKDVRKMKEFLQNVDRERREYYGD